jgi:outer membrane receptor protein involved in Fe transport
LKGVSIVADKPFIERQLDRTVVNIENSIVQTNSSLIEVMEKLPGVLVNQDGVISLKGKQGVIITIDDKPTGLSGQDLGNLLKSMPSSNIQKIEIITNPSAKYDAAGNAGIINIVTKKNKRVGFNGSVAAGYGQGVYEKYNASTNISYKKDWYNLFFSYGYAHRKGFNNLMLKRYFYRNDTLETLFDTDNYIVFPFNTHTPRVGADFTLSPKSTVSVLASSVINHFAPTAYNHTDIYNGSNEKVNENDFTKLFIQHTIKTSFRYTRAGSDN